MPNIASYEIHNLLKPDRKRTLQVVYWARFLNRLLLNAKVNILNYWIGGTDAGQLITTDV